MSRRANQTAKRHNVMAFSLQLIGPAGIRRLSVRAPAPASPIKCREHAMTLRFLRCLIGPSADNIGRARTEGETKYRKGFLVSRAYALSSGHGETGLDDARRWRCVQQARCSPRPSDSGGGTLFRVTEPSRLRFFLCCFCGSGYIEVYNETPTVSHASVCWMHLIMPAKKGRTCFVPLCKGGYKSAAEKVSLFRAPVDPLRRQEWARNIKREDKVLDETCVVCSRHFDERYIEKTFMHVINGELVELDRERPVLTDDAVPTIFPNAPSYLTRPVPKKRKERNLADRGTPPLKRRAASGSTHDCDPGNACTEPAPETHPFSDILPPSMYCSRIVLSNDPTALCFGWHARTEPDDQRLAVRTCFEAASRKSSRGMAYDMQWVLECILMRMRSPQLYEYVRRHKILALPSKSGFKSMFGFNVSVFSALEKKTRDMDEFSRHGGLVYDEIKLSENINVTASGELSGFVDLGPFMEDSNETAQNRAPTAKLQRAYRQQRHLPASSQNIAAPRPR
ncbi:hypothetical protein HPB47_024323 [Ixodes persulcatus]|uniref:Uncharacterized protein n=1 Tax=Ixodes persulcatus TaxID=34615 RepID=A0AC60Q6K3_IXOPE|nr:hypothetical protein HPB47_024323 [Ixodes persulcatus]